MSKPTWTRLAEAFEERDVAWTVVEVGDGGDEVRVVPRLQPAALQARLDAAAGVGGWSVTYAAMPGDAVACHLLIDGVTKGAVAAPARVGGGAVTAAVAFHEAAALFGARVAGAPGSNAWVPCDPATLEPLHAPALEPPAAGGAERSGRGDSGAAVTPSGAPGSEVDGAARAEAPGGAPPGEPAPKRDGQELIDRLIERLKAEGQGLAAARILVKHGGYGRDPQAARVLYAELRELLRSASVERDAEAPGAPSGRPG